MTREEAIKVLMNTEDNINYDKRRNEIYFTHEWMGAYEMAISALREQESLAKKQATSDWISVEERLPDEFVSVLICVPREAPLSEVREAYLANGWWASKTAIFQAKDVTHWMPMPEAPKEEV